jgi:hypothetical protein
MTKDEIDVFKGIISAARRYAVSLDREVWAATRGDLNDVIRAAYKIIDKYEQENSHVG